MINIRPVIMAGGFGKRLWPLSTTNLPKQFLRIFDKLSLLQQTLIRNSKFGKPCIMINRMHKHLADSQVQELNMEVDLVVEPVSKNTAPASIIAGLQYNITDKEFLLFVPCDHYINDIDDYADDINKAISYAERHNIVIIGSKATAPNINYGYVKTKKEIASNVYLIEKFKEKPNIDLATQYVNEGNYFWNSGIFIINTNFLLEKAKILNPVLYSYIYKSFISSKVSTNITTIAKYPYSDIAPISWDFAVMEHINDLILIESTAVWKDLGSFETLGALNTTKQNEKFERSWGYYEIISNSNLYKAKKIVIKSGLKISLQYHLHRAEHWVIIKGRAEVTIGRTKKLARPGDSFYIPIKSVHQIRNVDDQNELHLIEIQMGAYLSEGDIVRLDKMNVT
jgi:mannose-1-phosphate guanylyltransferase